MASSCKPHAVIFPYPAQGHINPMMQLAKKLAAHGVSITIITLDYYLSRISQSQQTHPSSSSHNGIRLIGIPDGLPDDCNRDLMGPYLGPAIEKLGGAMENLLLDLLAQQPITCVIGDCFLSRVREVVNKLQLPRIVFWPQCATTFTLQYHIDAIIATGFDPFEGTVNHFGPKLQPLDLITCVPGVVPIHPAYLPFQNPFGVQALQWVKSWIAEQFGNMDEAFWVIGNAIEELEPKVCNGIPKFQPMGPLIPSAFLGEEDSHDTRTGTSFWKEDDCTQWLDMQPHSSVVYVSFGSLTKFSIAQIQEIALGLLASKHRFLWVVRPDSVIEDVTNVLEALPEGFADEAKEQGQIISWAPQAAVLAHPAVCGFFSHCGWNSTLESICTGVPLLGWPHMFDQVTNCWLAANEWKIGVALKTDEDNKTDRREVERAVRLLMEGEAAEEMRTRAAKLKDVARMAIKDGSSHKRFELLIEELFRRAQH